MIITEVHLFDLTGLDEEHKPPTASSPLRVTWPRLSNIGLQIHGSPRAGLRIDQLTTRIWAKHIQPKV
jgi:hypothetical protein